MNKWQKDVRKFHQKFGQPNPNTPSVLPDNELEFRWSLVEEEIEELYLALQQRNLVKSADAIVDSIYVLLGTAISLGIDIDPIWKEVHKTNMAKEGGLKREDGKIMKPKDWEPPDIESLLIKQGLK